jgi:small redox-active disulfide protein 2
MIIKVLGSGCSKCKKLEENVRKALAELGSDATVEKVSDLQTIMSYGVMMTPALVIDEKVVSSGKILSAGDIKVLINKGV